jgi:hypothetical protein
MQMIDKLGDAAQKAAPLTDLARALGTCGMRERATEVFLRALNAARISGLDAVSSTLENGVEIAVGAGSACIAEAVRNAEALWAVPGR